MKDLNYYITNPQAIDSLSSNDQIKLYQTLIDTVNSLNTQISSAQAKVSVYQQEYDTKLKQLLEATNQQDLQSLESYLNNQKQVLLNTLKDYSIKISETQNQLSTINTSNS